MDCTSYTMDCAVATLRDAGCDEQTVAKFIELQELGQSKEQQRLLAVVRRSLLQSLHLSQQRLDCLDYLIYKTK